MIEEEEKGTLAVPPAESLFVLQQHQQPDPEGASWSRQGDESSSASLTTNERGGRPPTAAYVELLVRTPAPPSGMVLAVNDSDKAAPASSCSSFTNANEGWVEAQQQRRPPAASGNPSSFSDEPSIDTARSDRSIAVAPPHSFEGQDDHKTNSSGSSAVPPPPMSMPSTATTTTILGPILRPSPPAQHHSTMVSPLFVHQEQGHAGEDRNIASSHLLGTGQVVDEVMYHRNRTETPSPPPPPPPPMMQESLPRQFLTIPASSATGTAATSIQDSMLRRKLRVRTRPAPLEIECDDRRNPLLSSHQGESNTSATATAAALHRVAGVCKNDGSSSSSSSMAGSISNPSRPLSTNSPALAWWRWGRRRSQRASISRARRATSHAARKARGRSAQSSSSTVLLGNSSSHEDDYKPDRTTNSETAYGGGRGSSPHQVIRSRSPLSVPLPPSFTEEDWTPLDTSYGAALPVGGWIPKTIRRLIECGILAALVGTLVGLVVVTSIKLHASATSSSAGGGGASELGQDDLYINSTNATWNWNATAYGGDDLVA